MTTRLATPNDTRELASVLARAFENDPIYLWSFGESNQPWSRRFFRWQLRRLMPQRVTWTTNDLSGAAVWALPGQWRETTTELLRLILITTPAIRKRLRTVVSGLTMIYERHPVEPHLYLALLGVEPERQGEGIGSALLAPGLALCDRDGIPAYLETSKRRNLDFYARHGFIETGRVDVPGGPPVWTLWRQPR